MYKSTIQAKMSINSSEIIEITHVINPHLFWFKYKDIQNADVEKIELALKNHVAKFGDAMLARNNADDEYKCADYVAVYMESKDKWIRGEIDAKITTDEIIVWAIDYGIPLKKSIDWIVLLSEELKNLCRTTEPAIIKGGIAKIWPATHRITVNIILYFSFNFSC